MLELEEFNTSYIQAKLELERITEELTTKLTNSSQRINQTTKSISHSSPIDGQERATPVPPSSVLSRSNHLHPKQPGNFHKFMLVSEITLDKFYIISEKERNDYKFIFGIPTIARPQNHKYLSETLTSLLKDSTSIQKLNILLIIYVADVDTERCSEIIKLVRSSFGQFVSAGTIEILCPHASLYPSLVDLPSTLGDPVNRIKWRSKQTLDFAFLMSYASTKGEYYLHLEDDVIASDGYAAIIANHVDSVVTENWFLIHFSRLGFIGKLMRCNDLISFSQFLLLYYANQPSDWLMEDYVRGLVCYYSMPPEQCSTNLEKIYPFYSPSLFQHMGTVSSLDGKIQKIKDPLFKETPDIPFAYPAYSNPPAKVDSNFSIYSQHTAHRLYEGKDIFWSNSINTGDEIIVEFNVAQQLKGFIVRSGNEKHPGDKLEHGKVQYKMKGGEEFEHWCDFKDGEAHCSSPTPILVAALRVSASQPQIPWLIISQFECILSSATIKVY